MLTRWTEERAAAARVMRPLKPFGSTAIYDAIASALPMVETRTRQRAALLVISDGADTASDVTLRELRSVLLRSDAFVYAVAIDASAPVAINTEVNPTALREVTDQSGGRTIVVHDSSEASTALADIAEELNSQYLIGYSSPKGDDGKYHSIRVRVRGTDHRVRARNGYVARPKGPPS
jgi:VWFA-related protein